MGVLWPLEPATAAKHRLYQRYLNAWWPILLQPSARGGYRRPRVTYVDAFAGPGRYEGGEEGSPIFILRNLLNHSHTEQMALSRERVRLVFIEADKARHEHLAHELASRFGPLEDLPVRVEVHHGEAGRDTIDLLTHLQAWGQPILAVFDSWGNVNVPLELMHRIARNPSSESIVTFGPNWFSRQNQVRPEILDAVYGGREFWQQPDAELRPDERWRAWLEAYRDALHRAGFTHRLQFRIVPRTGNPLHLVYGTGHDAGLRAMKDAMWDVDPNDGESFKDPRTRGAIPAGQQDLFGAVGMVQPELLELVDQRLSQGPATVEQIRIWLLRETARWRETDARPAVEELRKNGAAAVEPAGRVTRKSWVTRA